MQSSSPTFIQVSEACKSGCGTCEIIYNAIIRFNLVQTAIGGRSGGIPGTPLEYTDDNRLKRTFVDTSGRY
jgi:hypothetical protein